MNEGGVREQRDLNGLASSSNLLPVWWPALCSVQHPQDHDRGRLDPVDDDVGRARHYQLARARHPSIRALSG